jgi:hypothetical protein
MFSLDKEKLTIEEHTQTSFFLAMGGGQCHTLTNVLSPCHKKAEMGRLSHAAG